MIINRLVKSELNDMGFTGTVSEMKKQLNAIFNNRNIKAKGLSYETLKQKNSNHKKPT